MALSYYFVSKKIGTAEGIKLNLKKPGLIALCNFCLQFSARSAQLIGYRYDILKLLLDENFTTFGFIRTRKATNNFPRNSAIGASLNQLKL